MVNTQGIKKTEDSQFMIPFTIDEVNSICEAISFLDKNNYSRTEELEAVTNKFVTCLYMDAVWIDGIYNTEEIEDDCELK